MQSVNHKQIIVRGPWARTALRQSNSKQRNGWQVQLKVLTEVVGMKPTYLIVSLPKLAGFVDINLARLPNVSPTDLLADLQRIDPSLEDTSLAAEIGGADMAERGSKHKLSLVKKVAIGVVGKIELVALPLSFQLLLVTNKRRKRWGVIRNRAVLEVIARRCRSRRLRRDAADMLVE